MSPEDIADGFGHWLAGFIDGEGCFHLKVINQDWIVCSFQIGLRLDDLPILKEIHQRTGLGSIHLTRRHKWHGNDAATWSVTRKAETIKLVALLDEFPLRAKKARDYAIWREAVFVWIAARKGSRWHGRSTHTAQLWDLKRQLEAGRVYSVDEIPLPEPPDPDEQLEFRIA